MKDYKVDKESFSESFRKEVYEVVSQIPVGKVVPDELSIPCHRVVNSTGRLVPGWVEQKQLLLAEEVSFKANGCVNLKEHLWHVDE